MSDEATFAAMVDDIAKRGSRLASSAKALATEAETMIADAKDICDALKRSDIAPHHCAPIIHELERFRQSIKSMMGSMIIGDP